jgi:hypothetical protein
LALPRSLSTGRTFGAPSTAGTVGWAGGQVAEVPGEPLLAGVAQMDVSEHQGFVLIERGGYRGDGVRGSSRPMSSLGDFGTDAAGHLADVQVDSGRGRAGSPRVCCGSWPRWRLSSYSPRP